MLCIQTGATRVGCQSGAVIMHRWPAGLTYASDPLQPLKVPGSSTKMPVHSLDLRTREYGFHRQ
jgi:hypothetical protein